MSFVTLNEVLADAQKRHYAVGAFNTNNMEIVQAIVEAAEEERAPVILQASQGALKYAGIRYITAMIQAAAQNATVPVVLHLDHGPSFAQAMQCLRHGFSSVMFDGSKYPLAENIALTRQVVEVAHAMGVSVEGELGRTAVRKTIFPWRKRRFLYRSGRGGRFCGCYGSRCAGRSHRYCPRPLQRGTGAGFCTFKSN